MFPAETLLNAIIAQTPDGAPVPAPAQDQSVVLQYLDQGGWMMYVILAVSVLGAILFLERLINLYLIRHLNTRNFINTLVTHLEQKNVRQALDACQIRSRHPLVDVAKAGIVRANRKEKEIERAMENQMLSALPSLQRGVAIMALLANIATLLGLLGTIFGLISAFTSVSAASAAERQTALASGISVAMYTTAFGISVAVPLLFFHHVLSRRSEKIIMEVEGGATALLIAMTGIKREPPASAG